MRFFFITSLGTDEHGQHCPLPPASSILTFKCDVSRDHCELNPQSQTAHLLTHTPLYYSIGGEKGNWAEADLKFHETSNLNSGKLWQFIHRASFYMQKRLYVAVFCNTKRKAISRACDEDMAYQTVGSQSGFN